MTAEELSDVCAAVNDRRALGRETRPRVTRIALSPTHAGLRDHPSDRALMASRRAAAQRRLRQTRRSLEAMVSGEPQLRLVQPRSLPAMSPRISRLGILTGGVVAQGIAQLAAFSVAYFGVVPSLVNAVIHPYEEAATTEEVAVAVFWFGLLMISLGFVVVMNRFARYMHQWWLGEVASRVAEHYDIPWPLIAKATRYKPLARGHSSSFLRPQDMSAPFLLLTRHASYTCRNRSFSAASSTSTTRCVEFVALWRCSVIVQCR